jgi:hypothetical protein
MAKTTEKKVARKAPATKNTPSKKSSAPDIESAARIALTKLRELSLDDQLQAELDWCLGSYSFDKNPTGLYEMVQRAIKLFATEKEKKTKGITAKLLADLEKGVKQ